jgi:hypothetical protein
MDVQTSGVHTMTKRARGLPSQAKTEEALQGKGMTSVKNHMLLEGTSIMWAKVRALYELLVT